MNYNQATLRAATGDIIMLPGWQGYFKWDFEKNELYFQNGDYYLNEQQIREMISLIQILDIKTGLKY